MPIHFTISICHQYRQPFGHRACIVRRFCSRECMHAFKRSPENLFWRNVRKTDGCWIWTSRLDEDGYGTFATYPGPCTREHRHTKVIKAHRYSWELQNGPIPVGLCVCHTCDVNYAIGDIFYRKCVRPDHLFLASNVENTADKMAKGRHRFHIGEQCSNAKLSNEQVRQIRGLMQILVSHEVIAQHFGVSRSAISMIAGHRTWRHVT